MIIIADSSALIALAICDLLPLLKPLFGEIKVPLAVFQEININNKPQAHVLTEYITDKIVTVNLPMATIERNTDLGKGEIEAIALYKQIAADLLLIDDARAKKTAYINNVETMGSLGVLL